MFKFITAISILAVILFSSVEAYTEVENISDCYSCISLNSNIMCRDLAVEKMAYCCTTSETAGACKRRDFCSSQVLTLSMKMITCPYVSKSCGTTGPNLAIKNNSTSKISLNYKTNKYFNSTAICYYIIKADSNSFDLESQKYFYKISVTSYNNTYIHINNGTTVKNAYDSVEVNELTTGTEFTYKAYNNTIYLIVVGYDSYPSATIEYSVYKYPVDVVITNTSNTTNQTIEPTQNITDDVNTTIVFVKKQEEVHKPQLAHYAIIGLISLGVIIYIIIEILQKKKTNDKMYLDFESTIGEKQTNREDTFSSNRKLVTNDDYGTRQTESGLMNRDSTPDKQNNLLTLNDNTFMDKSIMQDKSYAHDQSTTTLQLQHQSMIVQSQKSKFSKVHPFDLSNTSSTIVPKEETKEDKNKSFWSRFKKNDNDQTKKKDNVRKFSIINPQRNISILPASQQTFEIHPSDQITNVRHDQQHINLSIVTAQPGASINDPTNLFGSLR